MMGHKEYGGIIKVVAVVNMVLNFLVTDKSIMAEWFKRFSPYIKFIGTKGATDWTNVVNEQNFSTKSMTN